MRAAALIAVLTAAVAVAAAQGAAGSSGIRELATDALVSGIAADGTRVAVNVDDSFNCDRVAVWTPVTGERLGIRSAGYCEGGGGTFLGALAGTRLLWEDGISGNLYQDNEDFTVDAGTRGAPAGLYSYEYTHDEENGQTYGPMAGPFAGHGGLLVFATEIEHVRGPATSTRLWRFDGRHRTLIRHGIAFFSLSVDRDRIAGAVVGGTVVLLSAEGHTIRTFSPPARFARSVVLQGDDLAVAGRDRVLVYDTRTGRPKPQRRLAPASTFEDYSRGLVAVVRANTFRVRRVSDGREAVVARVPWRGLEGYSLQADLEPAGLYYTYTVGHADSDTGHVVFVPWQTLIGTLR
jgi:hypothetical protein